MKRQTVFVLICLFSISLINCGSMTRKSNEFMSMSEATKSYKPSTDMALFIFERDNTAAGSSHNISLWDVTDTKHPKFFALLANTMKAAYQTRPGKHVFLAIIGPNRVIMQANVEAGKTYYVMAGFRPFSGAHFFPIKKGEPLKMTRTNIAELKTNAKEWAGRAVADESVNRHLIKGMTIWNKLSTNEKAALTLMPEDGR